MENNITAYRDNEIPRYAVIKANGTYAGIFCISYEEAVAMASGHEGSHIYELIEVQ